MSKSFPIRAEDITAEWLSGVLRQRGVLGAGRVQEVVCEPVEDQGQTSEVAILRIRYQDAGPDAPDSLVAKFATTDEASRALAGMFDSYYREIAFYRVMRDEQGLPLPTVYAAEVDREAQQFVLLMEDLSAGRNGTLFEDDPEGVRLGLEQLAKVHARFWRAPMLDQHDWIKTGDDPEYLTMLHGLWTGIAPTLPDVGRGKFGSYAQEVAQKWLDTWGPSMEILPDEAQTLLHVDAHPKQMFFPTADFDRCVIFDWQSPTKGVPGGDVARLIITGLSTDNRRKHETALIDHYHRALVANGVSDLPREELTDQVKLGSLASFFINVIAVMQTDVALFEAQAARVGADWEECMLGRVNAALEDWKMVEVLERRAAKVGAR